MPVTIEPDESNYSRRENLITLIGNAQPQLSARSGQRTLTRETCFLGFALAAQMLSRKKLASRAWEYDRRHSLTLKVFS